VYVRHLSPQFPPLLFACMDRLDFSLFTGVCRDYRSFAGTLSFLFHVQLWSSCFGDLVLTYMVCKAWFWASCLLLAFGVLASGRLCFDINFKDSFTSSGLFDVKLEVRQR
jgi:hypothetical protein